MKSFRGDKASLVLKLCLPLFCAEVAEEAERCERLNRIYSALSEAYSDKLGNLVSSHEERMSVSVNFRIVTDVHIHKYKRLLRKTEKPLIIERYIRSNLLLPFVSERYLDFIDMDRAVLLK